MGYASIRKLLFLKLLTILIILLLIFLSGCAVEKCGDGICDDIEKQRNICPEDCEGTTPPQAGGDGVLYITTITHIEKWKEDKQRAWNYHDDDKLLKEHEEILKDLADLYDKHEAKLTIEASTSMANGIKKFGNNILLELQQRGHGIGAHMDLGLDAQASIRAGKGVAGVTYQELVEQMEQQKNAIDSVLDQPIVHNSGTPSTLDWVGASVESGFECHTSAVTYYLLPVPEQDRPEGWTDKYILSGNYHYTFPFDIADRVNPWKMESGANWFEHSTNGKLIYIPGESGVQFSSFYEYYAQGVKDHEELARVSTFTKEDVDGVLENLKQVMSYTDKNKVNTYYIMLTMDDIISDRENNFELLEYFLSEIDKYVKQGKVQWKSVPEMCEAYQDWE